MPTYSLTLRGSLDRRLTIEETDNNWLYLQELALSGSGGATGPQGETGATGPQGPTGSGTENTFTMSAHPSLTLADVGKWVMSYSDPDFEDFVLNAGPTTSLDSYTGSQGVAKLVELTGAQDGSPGEWIFDLTQEYGGVTWSALIGDDNNIIFQISSINSVSFYVKNLHFQPTDPYLASIVGSLSYTQSNPGWGTFSFPSDEESAAIMIEYYANNGFPDSNYTADGSFGDPFPYHITTTQSVWTSATRSGTELTLTLDPSANVLDGGDYIQVYYFNESEISANVEIQFSVQNSLQFPILGILEDVSDGVATISDYPLLYEFVVNEGLPTQSGTTSMIYTIPRNLNQNDSILINYWVVPEGSDGLINFLVFASQFDNESVPFSLFINGPIYTPLHNGMAGDLIKFKKVTPSFN